MIRGNIKDFLKILFIVILLTISIKLVIIYFHGGFIYYANLNTKFDLGYKFWTNTISLFIVFLTFIFSEYFLYKNIKNKISKNLFLYFPTSLTIIFAVLFGLTNRVDFYPSADLYMISIIMFIYFISIVFIYSYIRLFDLFFLIIKKINLHKIYFYLFLGSILIISLVELLKFNDDIILLFIIGFIFIYILLILGFFLRKKVFKYIETKFIKILLYNLIFILLIIIFTPITIFDGSNTKNNISIFNLL